MNTYKIMIVEDDPDDLFLLLRLLGRLNQKNTIRVPNGEQALHYLHHRAAISPALLPDLIISDICMPAMDGIELLKILKSHDSTRAIPVVVCSSSILDRHMRACNSLGILEYLRKPLAEEDIKRIIVSLETARTAPILSHSCVRESSFIDRLPDR